MKHLLIVLAVILGFVMPLHTTMAGNLRFLKNSVAAQFDDADWDLLQNAVTEVLEHHVDGSKVTWTNDKSGHWGTVTAVRSTQDEGLKCRLVRFVNHAKNRTGGGTFKYCHTEDGWKVAN